MEQTAASILVDALHQLIHFKPKFPHLNGRESVLKFLALYIKGNYIFPHLLAHNPSNPSYLTEKYSQKVEEFRAMCGIAPELLDAYRSDSEAVMRSLVGTEFKEKVHVFDNLAVKSFEM